MTDGLRHETEIDAQAATAAAAGQEAAVLQSAGHREASVLATAGQRRINLLWEVTQSLIAIGVTGSTLFVAAALALSATTSGPSAVLQLMSNAFFLIIGFYFSRTNHQKIGGVLPGDEGR